MPSRFTIQPTAAKKLPGGLGQKRLPTNPVRIGVKRPALQTPICLIAYFTMPKPRMVKVFSSSPGAMVISTRCLADSCLLNSTVVWQ